MSILKGSPNPTLTCAPFYPAERQIMVMIIFVEPAGHSCLACQMKVIPEIAGLMLQIPEKQA